MTWDRNPNWLLSCNKCVGHWSEAWENNSEWSGNALWDIFMWMDLGMGNTCQIFLSHSSDYQGAFTQGGCYKWVKRTAHPVEAKRFDSPMHSLTQTEPSVSSCFYYGISKWLASEAYLTSSMIAQESSYLNRILSGILNSFWSGRGSDVSALKWTDTLDSLFLSLTLKFLSVIAIWGLIEWQTTFYCILQSVDSDQRICSLQRKDWHNHRIYCVYSKPQKLLAWKKKSQNSLSGIKLRY